VNRITQICIVESSTSSDRQQRRPDVRRNSVDMTALPADDWQQDADALMQSQRLERNGYIKLTFLFEPMRFPVRTCAESN